MLKLTIADLKDGLRPMMQLAQWKTTNLRLAYNIGRTWKDYKERVAEADEMESALYREFDATEEKAANGMVVLNLPPNLSLERRKVFDAKITEWRAVEVEVWGHPLPFEDLEKAGLSLSGDDYSLLSWLICDPAEAAEAEKPKSKKAKAA